MDRICNSCGAEAGAGAFCQHCGTRLAQDGAAAPQSTPSEPLPPQTPNPTSTEPASAPIPPVVPEAKGRGCRSGCLIAGVVALLLLAVGVFFAWRFVNDEVLPGIEGAVNDATGFSEAPPGPCYDLDTDDGLLVGWTEVPCTGSRQVEVTFAASFEDGPFPGDEYLSTTARDTCVAAFERYVGLDPGSSEYDVEWLLPTEQMWADGSRQGICLVVADDGTALTGEVKGSGI